MSQTASRSATDILLKQSNEKLLQEFSSAVSDDLALLGVLHATELDATTLTELKALNFPDCLGLSLASEKAPFVLKHLREVVAEWPDKVSSDALDVLAADYAAIYLNTAMAASPQESYWLDDENLVMQNQMFQVREIYEKHGLETENWRVKADDHLVNELSFLSHVITQEEVKEEKNVQGLRDAARFLDDHLLRWLGTFSERVAGRCDTAFYAGLVLLTDLYCEELRDLLAAILDEPRPTEEEIDERMTEKLEPIPVPVQFVPGAKPSW